MKSIDIFAVMLTAFCFQAASAQTTTPPPNGAVCYSKTLRPSDGQQISCPGIGKFTSVGDIYSAGYRVVSTGVIQEAGGSTIFLIIEERK